MVTTDEIEAAARILGIASQSTATDIRRAYRRAAKRHHPDAGGDTATFRMVHEAYEILRTVAADRTAPTAPGAPVRVVNAYGWVGAPSSTVGRWVDVAA